MEGSAVSGAEVSGSGFREGALTIAAKKSTFFSADAELL